MLLFLSTPALALDCTGLDADVCNAVNDIAVLIENTWGSPVVADDAPKARLRTDALYDQLLELQDHLDTFGCTVDGVVGGRYLNRVSFQGEWVEDGGDFGTQSGILYRNSFARGFTGTYSGTRSGDIGNEYGHYARKQFAGNRDGDAFMAGGFATVKGRRGVYYGLTGTCTDHNARVLDYWYERELWPYYPLRMFASTPWNNPGEGIGPMDAHCQADWDAAHPDEPTVFKAAVSDQPNGILTPAQRFPDGPALELASSGDYVAPDVYTWFNPNVSVAEVLDEQADGTTFTFGGDDDNEGIAWWGYDFKRDVYDGFSVGDCDGWTSSDSMSLVPLGGIPFTDSRRLYAYFVLCSDLFVPAGDPVDPERLYRTVCIEDTDPTDD